MVDVSSQNNSVSINVTSGGNSASIKATPDTAQYYSEKSREWAISNRIVDNTDYSSKYYAEKSKESEAKTENYERSVIEKYNSFVEISNQAETEFETLKNNSILQINEVTNLGISDIANKTSEAVTEININKQDAISEIGNTQNNAVEQLEKEAKEQLQNIESTGFYMRDDKLYFINSKGEEEEFKSGDDNAANKDLSNLSEVGERHFLGNSNITNCIRKKPQKFNLELTDGVLTLKANSIVTVANGFEADGTTPKFDEKVVNANVSSSSATANTKVLISYSTSSNVLIALPLANSTAGAGVTAKSGLAFNTTTNKISSYNSSGSLQYADCCLPLAIVSTDSSGKYTTIDQIFYGIGYIGTAGTTGSTVWVDKDITMIISEDKNGDGTYKNIVFTTTRTLLRNGVKGETRRSVSFYSTNAIGIGTGFMSARTYADRDSTFGYQYVEDLNKTFVSTRDYAEPLCIIADITCNANAITSFRPRNTFRALDSNDRGEITSWGFPSNHKITIATTITQVSGGYRTLNGWQAPADGWIMCTVGTSVQTRVQMMVHSEEEINPDSQLLTNHFVCLANIGTRNSIKISKGQYFTLQATAAISSATSEFIYAKGAL